MGSSDNDDFQVHPYASMIPILRWKVLPSIKNNYYCQCQNLRPISHIGFQQYEIDICASVTRSELFCIISNAKSYHLEGNYTQCPLQIGRKQCFPCKSMTKSFFDRMLLRNCLLHSPSNIVPVSVVSSLA